MQNQSTRKRPKNVRKIVAIRWGAEMTIFSAEDKDSSEKTNCKIFLGYTSNMASCGVRDVIKFLVKNRMVDCIVATAGGIEEDFIKCLAPTYIGKATVKIGAKRTCTFLVVEPMI